MRRRRTVETRAPVSAPRPVRAAKDILNDAYKALDYKPLEMDMMATPYVLHDLLQRVKALEDAD